jgi:regulation of enolase protein 1 (concanavalin A-like superfamily)
MRIIRRGNEVTAQISEDGKAWQTLARITLELPETVLIGLASTSHAAGTLGEAVFSDWELVAE